MYNDNSILVEYDDVLIGRKKAITKDYFYGETKRELNRIPVRQILKYAVTYLLEWDDDTAYYCFDEYMMQFLHLKDILKYIDYPDEVKKYDPHYTLSFINPKIHIDEQTLIYDLFKRVNSGEESQFPRNYFLGGKGIMRYSYCIKYIIETELFPESIPEIYDFFSSSQGRKCIIDHHLRIAMVDYKIDIYYVIYAITASLPMSRFWYSYYLFRRWMYLH